MLWVGNSFSYCNDLPGMVQKIASTQKGKTLLHALSQGRRTLRDT